MGKVDQVSNGATGLTARTAYNEAMKEVEVDGSTITGTGETGTPLTVGTITESELNASVNTSLDLADSALQNIVSDTTPQLGGTLDLNGNNIGDASSSDLTKLSEITATSTELNYIDGVTSSIQTQIDGKEDDLGNPSTNGDVLSSTTGGVRSWITLGGGGDMVKSTYDPANISEQLVGLNSSQTLTNKTVNGVVLDSGSAGSQFLADDGTYKTPGGGGDVTGPASSVDNRIATFDGTTGKLIKDSGSLVSDFATAAQGTKADSALQDLVDDTTPQLGGQLNLNGNNVGSASAADLTKLSEVTATSTELNYVDGVTSNVQTQLDAKQSDIDGTAISSATAALTDHAVYQENTGATLKRDSWADIFKLFQIPLGIACSDETTDLTTGTAKATFRMPFAATVHEVRATLTTAPVLSASSFSVDINESGTSILSTKITIDSGEKTSVTAATPPVISDSSLADDAEITIDIDSVGDTTAGAGLKIWLIVSKA